MSHVKTSASAILFVILLSAFASAEFAEGVDRVFIVNFALHKDGTVVLKDFSLKDGTQNAEENEPGNYNIRLVSDRGETLFSTYDSPLFEAHREVAVPCVDIGYPANITEDGMCVTGEDVKLQSIERLLRIPYFKEAGKLEFLYQGKVMTSVGIPAEVCKSGDGICDDYCRMRSDSDCPAIIPPKSGEGKNQAAESRFPVELLIIFIVLAVALVFLILRKRKNRDGLEGSYDSADSV